MRALRCLLAVLVLASGFAGAGHAQTWRLPANHPAWWRHGASLELDFLRNRYMVSLTAPVAYTSLTEMLAATNGTFSRASTATYFDANGVMRTAAIDEPRLDHDPLTGAPLGYLHELNKTNYLTQSANLSMWTVSGTASLLSRTTAPDGTTAYSLDAATPMAGVWRSFAVADGNPTALSIFVKNVSGSGAIVVGNDAPGEVSGGVPALLAFDTTTGSVTSATAALAWQKVQPMKNGWYRLSFAYTASGTTGRMVAYHGDSTPGENAFWGGQSEPTFFTASSYIPTTTTTNGRAHDSFRFVDAINTGWANPTGEGTIYLSGVNYEGSRNPGSYWSGLFYFSQDNDSGNMIHNRSGYASSSFSWYVELFVAGVVRASGAREGECLGSVHQSMNRARMAYAFKSGDLRGACGGILDSAASTYAGLPLPLFNLLRLGSSRANVMIGHIRHFTYFPYRMPDRFLQDITTYGGD